MSLTAHLRDAASPVRAFLDGISPGLADTLGRTEGARVAAGALGLGVLVQSKTAVPPLPGVDAARAGTAVDFRTRIALGGFDPFDSAAALGIAQLPMYEDEVDNGPHRARVLTEAFDVAVRLLRSSSDEADFDRAALVLAHCEQIYRGGAIALKGSVGEACDRAADGRDFVIDVDESSMVDLRALMESNVLQIEEWREWIAAGERFEPNPVFSGARLVGGADADWLVGDTLIDCKAYASLTVTKLRAFLRQLLGYVMLDLDDALSIRRVGVWLPRQGLTRIWSLEHLLGGDPEELLPTLREEFRKATSKQQLAVREPVSQRRMHQILADNRHTPRRMLIELARSEDRDIRFRAGRNAITPQETLRELALDRYARAREGVASNERAPLDLLKELSRDKSVAVRRAAADNLRASSQVGGVVVQTSAKTLSTPAFESPADETSVLHAGHPTVVRIRQDRGDASFDSKWFAEFLCFTHGRRLSGFSWFKIPLPMASQRWADQVGRSIEVPEWLEAGLPEAVKADLMREGRPVRVRRLVAGDLSVADPATRDMLLADSDPEIRWSALQRTIDTPDDGLSSLLGELAADRKERIRFRTEGKHELTEYYRRTPAEFDSEVLQFIASHPWTPLDALQHLMTTKSAAVLTALVENPALPAEDLESLLHRLRSIRSVEHRERLAASARIPGAVADVLCGDRDVRVRTALARNVAVPTMVLTRLAEASEPCVRLALVRNSNTPAALATSTAGSLLLSSIDEELNDVLRAVDRRDDVMLSEEILEAALERLSTSRVRDPDMRCIVANDVRSGPRLLKRLAKSTDESVRSGVARNPRTPAETLSALIKNPEPRVRSAAAGNETLELDLLAKLADDDAPEVRAVAANSPRLDPVLLAELLFDEDRSVRTAAFRNPMTHAADKYRAEVERDRAGRESAPSRAVLEEMAANKRAEVRTQVAYAPRTPSDILVLLGGERRSAQVRRAVAANPHTPPAVLTSLAEDKDEEVRQAVAFNSATPPEVLVDLAGRGIDLALLVAMNPDAPIGILDALAQDGDPLVGYVATGIRGTRATLASGASAGAPTLLEAEAEAEACSDRPQFKTVSGE